MNNMNNNIYYFSIHVNLFFCNRTNGGHIAVVRARGSAEGDVANNEAHIELIFCAVEQKVSIS